MSTPMQYLSVCSGIEAASVAFEPLGWKPRSPWRGKPSEECPDGPRYKALGNSWAVNCARYIGERIQALRS